MPTTDSGSAAAAAAVARVLPRHAHQIDIHLSSSPGPDRFEVSGPAGAIRISATTPATALAGLGWYLKHHAGVDVGWPGDSLAQLPEVLPAAAELVQTAVVPHRLAGNDTNDAYDGPIRSWADYEREIDLLALHGFNAILVTIGTDAVYHRALQEFGYTDAELRAWIPRPAIQPWWLLQNTAALAGTISAQLLADRAELAARIIARMHELGIRPVLPGYFGTVPPGFAGRNPDARTVEQGLWCGVPRPDWLDPRCEAFGPLAETFYRYQAELLGPANDFKMDPLHEGGSAGQVPVAAAARSIFEAMDAAHPAGRWVMIGWEGNPSADLLSQLPAERLMILNTASDRDNSGLASWPGHPQAFSSITNFGGRSVLGANAQTWVERFGPSAHGDVCGIAWIPECLGREAAGIELFAELAWRDQPITLTDWFADYARRRYGDTDGHGEAAWDILRRTAYSTSPDTGGSPHEGLFTARPDLRATHTSQWSSGVIRYSPATFAAALDQLLDCHCDTDAYRYDLIEVARQVLDNASRTLLPQMRAAYESADLSGLMAMRDTWLDWLDLLDQLLSASRPHLLGPLLAAARAAGHDDAEADALECDTRTLLTSWGTRPASEGGLHDYANREVAGLVRDVYRERWRGYLDDMVVSLRDGVPAPPRDWYAFDAAWAASRNSYPVDPLGDPRALAHRVRETIAEDPRLITITAAGRLTPAGVEVDVEVRNDNGFTPVQELDVQPDWASGEASAGVALDWLGRNRDWAGQSGTGQGRGHRASAERVGAQGLSAARLEPGESVGGFWRLDGPTDRPHGHANLLIVRYRCGRKRMAYRVPIRIADPAESAIRV